MILLGQSNYLTVDPATRVGLLAIAILFCFGLWMFIRWLFSGPPRPDPWSDEVAAEIAKDDAVPLCHRCLAPTTLCGRVQRDNVRWSAGLRPGLYGGLSRTRRTGGRRSGGGVEKPTLCALCDGESGQGFYSYTTRINSISDCVNSLNLHPAPMSDDSDYIHGASIFVGGGMTLYPRFEIGC